MIKKCLVICVVSVAAVTTAYAQARSKRVKQPREVLEAYRICTEFRSLLAENFHFGRAFDATYVKDPARRREIATADGERTNVDLSQVDTETLVKIYKLRVESLILVLPLMFASADNPAELFPPHIEALFERKPPSDPQQFQAYAVQLARDVAEFRAHVENVAAKNPGVEKNIREYKSYLLKPLEPPKRIVKPLTAYSQGRVLPLEAKYYQIDDCTVTREEGQMRLIGYIFFKMRW